MLFNLNMFLVLANIVCKMFLLIFILINSGLSRSMSDVSSYKRAFRHVMLMTISRKSCLERVNLNPCPLM